MPVDALIMPLKKSLLRLRPGAAKGAARTIEDGSTRAREDLGHLLMEDLPDLAAFTLDCEGVIECWTAGAERLIGYRANEVVGKHCQLFFEGGASNGTELLWGLREAGNLGRSRDERWCKRRDGSRFWAEEITKALYDQNGVVRGFATVLRNVSDRKSLEDDIRHLADAAETAQRAKNAFLANMSHEMRTPLGAIVGFAELIASPEYSAAERLDYLERVRTNGLRLARLVDNLLDASQGEAVDFSLEISCFRLADLASETLALLGPAARSKGLALELSIAPGVPDLIQSDRERLKEILLQVVGNAIKFTESGCVSIHIAADQEPPRLSFTVIDTGVGIDSRKAQRLFEPFTCDDSLNRSHSGAGLGMTLARRLTRALGGDLRLVSSRPGVGTTFVATVSTSYAHGRHDALSTKSVLSHPGAPLQGLKILLVDDARDNQMLISRILRLAGASVEFAANGREGVERAQQNDYDLILMDIQMPELDGYQATAELRRGGYKKPIIALTTHSLKEEREHCLAVGCNDHLSKPVSRNLLLSTVNVHAVKQIAGAETVFS